MLQKTEINGIDVSSYVFNWEFETTFGDALPEIKLVMPKTVFSIVDVTVGMTLEIWRGWVTSTDEKVFSGYIEKVEPENGKVTITGLDKLWDAVRHEVNKIYDSSVDPTAGKFSAIFTDLMTNYAGLTADATTVQDSGTVYTISFFNCIHTDPFERCMTIATTLDWQFYYLANTDKVYFEPKGFTNNSTILYVGTNIIEIPKWKYDTTQMTDDLTVIGASQEVETTFTGQIGVTSGFTTSYISAQFVPVSIRVYGDAVNPPTTLKAGGTPDSTTTFDYYVTTADLKIRPAPGTTFTTNDYYLIDYSYLTPIPVNMYDQNSIDNYGRFTKTITYDDVKSVSDAEIRGTNYLSKYSVPFTYTTIKVKNSSLYGLRVGQKIRIIDNLSSPNVDEFLVINKLRMRYPADYDELDVGDVYWRLANFQADLLNSIKRLNEREIQNVEIANNLVSINNATFSPVTIENRYNATYTQTASGTNLFILGNSSYGILGTNKLGDSGMGAETMNSLSHYLNKYDETFYDDDFKDSGNTNATWSNVNKWLSFTANQYAQSSTIEYNNGTITSATMTVTISSGTFNLYLTADGGSHWETCTSGVSHTFTNTGTDLRWKIIESVASTGKITEVVIQS